MTFYVDVRFQNCVVVLYENPWPDICTTPAFSLPFGALSQHTRPAKFIPIFFLWGLQLSTPFIIPITHELDNLHWKWAGDGEMAQWIEAITALTEDPGSIPRTHMTGHNHL